MVCPDTAPLQNLAVSPGLTLRPSLSVGETRLGGARGADVSPGLTLRPSLSAPECRVVRAIRCHRVAGVDAPAFVERTLRLT